MSIIRDSIYAYFTVVRVHSREAREASALCDIVIRQARPGGDHMKGYISVLRVKSCVDKEVSAVLCGLDIVCVGKVAAIFSDRMLASPFYDRMVDVMEELVKFTLLTRGCADYLVDRYSERLENGKELIERVAKTK